MAITWLTITSASRLPKQCGGGSHALDGEGLSLWVEEPVLAHDYDGHAFVAHAEIRTPIQCGENWWGPRRIAASHPGPGFGFRNARRDEDPVG